MPDLDQLLEGLVADVTATSHAPGAHHAITRARRRRARTGITAAAAATVVVLSAVAVVSGTFDGNDHTAPTRQPTSLSTDATQPTMVFETAGSPAALYDLGQELDDILTAGPGWAISGGFPEDFDYAFNGPCSSRDEKSWTAPAIGGADGGAPRPAPFEAGIGMAVFRNQAQATRAVSTFATYLETCPVTDWRTHPLVPTGPQTQVVFATSNTGVTWISQVGSKVRVLTVATTNGPPPADVQAQVADWMGDLATWHDQADEREKEARREMRRDLREQSR